MDPRDLPVHFTTLKHIEKSPAHYLEALRNPKDSGPFRLGRLVHQIVLGGPPSAVWSGIRRGKEWEAFKAANEGRDIVTEDELEQATAIANAVMADPVAAPFLLGEKEKPIEWEMFGRRCETRGIDVLGIIEGADFINDLKTASDAHPERFKRFALWRGSYHGQLAFYDDAARSLGRTPKRHLITCVETTPPYSVVVHELSPRALDAGRKLVRKWMEELINCERANHFPAYAQSILTLDVAEETSLIIDGEEIAA